MPASLREEAASRKKPKALQDREENAGRRGGRGSGRGTQTVIRHVNQAD